MAKTLMFKLRLDESDRQRLDLVAAHYSAPAATVLRILVKKEFEALRAAGAIALRPPEAPPPAAPRRRAPRAKDQPFVPAPDSYLPHGTHGVHALAEPRPKGQAKKRRPRTS
jgi:hypothetical protein